MNRMLMAAALTIFAPDSQAATLCPDGSFVNGPCQLAPDGSFDLLRTGPIRTGFPESLRMAITSAATDRSPSALTARNTCSRRCLRAGKGTSRVRSTWHGR